MNRVIKFRGIIKYPDDIFSGFWYGNLVIYANGDTFIRQIETGQEFEVIPETVGQFTELTDKNGKEIYEGDAVSFKRGIGRWSGKFITTNYIVSWDETVARFSLGTEQEAIKFRRHPRYEYEVIGNIHDNPELIQQP